MGTDFVLRDNTIKSEEEYQDVVTMSIYVGRPPWGIDGHVKQDERMVLQEEKIDAKDCNQLVKREPHFAQFVQPANNSNFLTGSRIKILFRDGVSSIA